MSTEPNSPIQDFITRSRAICDAATPGPWHKDGSNLFVLHDGAMIADLYSIDGELEDGGNGEFIAHARQALPAVLKALEIAREQIAFAADFMDSPSAQDALANIAAALEEAKP